MNLSMAAECTCICVCPCCFGLAGSCLSLCAHCCCCCCCFALALCDTSFCAVCCSTVAGRCVCAQLDQPADGGTNRCGVCCQLPLPASLALLDGKLEAAQGAGAAWRTAHRPWLISAATAAQHAGAHSDEAGQGGRLCVSAMYTSDSSARVWLHAHCMGGAFVMAYVQHV